MAGYDRSLYQMYLGAVPMFSRCASDQLDRIANLGDSIAISPGHDIVREGEEGNEFYVITSGKALVYPEVVRFYGVMQRIASEVPKLAPSERPF